MKHDDKKESDLERFRTFVEAYGANLERWPLEARRVAERALGTREAQAWLAEQSPIDAWLDQAPELAPSAALLRRVAEIPARHARSPAGSAWPFGRLWHVVAAAAAAAIMGITVGLSAPDLTSDNGTDEWDELSTLALGVDLSEVAP